MRVPVVGDLVVVPLGEHRRRGIEPTHVLVHQVVGVVAAKLGQRLGDLRFRVRGDVLPDAAVRHLLLGLDRTVGIDRVARVDEECGLDLAHGLVDLHAPPFGIDPPTLPRGIARPDEADVAPGGWRRPEAAGDRLARELVVGEVDHDHPVEHALAGRQAGKIDLGGEIGVLKRGRAGHQARIGEALGGRPLDHHARRPVGARPQDGAVAREVAGLHAIRQARAHALAGDHGGRALLGKRPPHHARGDQATACERRAAQQRAPAQAISGRFKHGHGCLQSLGCSTPC